jgi:RHS repeat-associated protein
MVDGSGPVVKTYGYDVYGKVTSSSGSAPNEFDFAGQQTDPTGLQYLRARYYDPDTGRLLSREPMMLAPGWRGNPFGYAGGNPTRFIDATGLWPGEGLVKKAGGAILDGAETVSDAALQSVETLAYGGYAASYEALAVMGTVPDPIEFFFLPAEFNLLLLEAEFLAISATADYLATGNYTNVYNDPVTGERAKSDWWPDFLVEAVGGDPAECYFPCTQLPGISPDEKPEGGGVHVDFQWPLGD